MMSLAKSPRLVGRLSADGTATLDADNTSSVNVTDSRGHWPVEASPDVGTSRSASESGAEEDYESVQHSAAEIVEGGKGGGFEEQPVHGKSKLSARRPDPTRLKSIPITLDRLAEKGKYVLTADKSALREILKLSIERVSRLFE
jgi:sterol O-acyltransferase